MLNFFDKIKSFFIGVIVFIAILLNTTEGAVNNYLGEGTPYTNYFFIPGDVRNKILNRSPNEIQPRIDYMKVKVKFKDNNTGKFKEEDVYVKYILPELSILNLNYYFVQIVPSKEDFPNIPMEVQEALSVRSIGAKNINLEGKFLKKIIPHYNTLKSTIMGVTEDELKEFIIPNLFIQLNTDLGCNKDNLPELAKKYIFNMCFLDGIIYRNGLYYLEQPKFLDDIIKNNVNWLKEEALFNGDNKEINSSIVMEEYNRIYNGLKRDDIDIIERNQLVKDYMFLLMRGYGHYCTNKFKDVELINQCVFASMSTGPTLGVLSPTGNNFGRYGNDFLNFIPSLYRLYERDEVRATVRDIYKNTKTLNPYMVLNYDLLISPKVMCLDLSRQDISKLNCFVDTNMSKHKFKKFEIDENILSTTLGKYIPLNPLIKQDGTANTDINGVFPKIKLQVMGDKFGRSF